MSREFQVSPGPLMRDYFLEVAKAFAEHCGPNETITVHAPQTHGHEPMHGQINLINRADHNCFKIKFSE